MDMYVQLYHYYQNYASIIGIYWHHFENLGLMLDIDSCNSNELCKINGHVKSELGLMLAN